MRTTSYSLPSNLHAHIEVIQPTTIFGRFRPDKSMISIIEDAPAAVVSDGSQISAGDSGVTVDASCNTTITVSCLKQLYNAVGVVGSGASSIGITGYLVRTIFENIYSHI